MPLTRPLLPGDDRSMPPGALLKLLFQDLLVFLPYLALYPLFWAFDWQVSTLLPVFMALHGVMLIAALAFCLSRSSRKLLISTQALFWVVLFVTLLLPGAYLEYPADGWEHLGRILRWQNLGTIQSYLPDVKGKFAYFWMYSWLSEVPVASRHCALSVLSAAWQLLIGIQIFRLSRRFGFDAQWSALQVVAFLILFGTNLFSYRYYSISSSPLAYAAYLQAIILALDVASGARSRRSLIYLLPYYGALIFFNHKQELLFLALSLTVIAGSSVYRKLSEDKRKAALKVLSLAVMTGFVFGIAAHSVFPQVFPNADPLSFSAFGSLTVWQAGPSNVVLQTLGVHGIIALALALISFRKRPLLSLLALAPISILLFPPTALLLAKIMPQGYLLYRILFALPTSLALVSGLEALSHKLSQTARLRYAAATIVIILLALPMSFPWRGRLYFQFYRPPKERTLAFLKPTVEWFFQNRDVSKLRGCWITTDDVTRTGLMLQLGARENFTGGEGSRRGGTLDGRAFQKTESLLSQKNLPFPFCGVLVADRSKVPVLPPSVIGRASGHWIESTGDMQYLMSEEFERAAEKLPEFGWSKTFVPPFYYYYEPA